MKLSQKEDVIDAIKNQILQEEKGNTIYKLPDNLKKNYAPYLLIREDIAYCIRATSKLIELKSKEPSDEDEKIIFKSLWIAVIITYGKCFTEGIVKLEPKDCIKSGSLQETHQLLINMRNDWVAHRNDSPFEQAIVYFKILKTNTSFHVKSLSATSNSVEVLNDFVSLFKEVHAHVEIVLRKKAEKIFNNQITKTRREVLYNWILK